MNKHTLKLVSTQDMSRADWLNVRRRGIGSSDAAAAVGLNPYCSPLALWLEKTGRSTNTDDAGDAAYWGTVLEPIVANEYARRTGRKVRRKNALLQHANHPFMLANLDREIVGSDNGPGILECKTCGYFAAKAWEDGVPEWYQLQVLHQLAVTGRAWADVAVLIAGQAFEIHRINRDEHLIADLIDLEARFWQQVQRDQPPETDGSASCRSALNQLFSKDSGAVLNLEDAEELEAAFNALVEAKALGRKARDEEERNRQKIQAAMGDATTAQFSAGLVHWKKCRDSTRLDSTRLEADYPDLAAEYTVIKPGARRLTISESQ